MPKIKPAAAPVVENICSASSCRTAGTYRMVGQCMNCKTSPIVGVFTRGHEANSGWNSPDCPVCGCRGKLYWDGLADE